MDGRIEKAVDGLHVEDDGIAQDVCEKAVEFLDSVEQEVFF